jgi:hypothetical protein
MDVPISVTCTVLYDTYSLIPRLMVLDSLPRILFGCIHSTVCPVVLDPRILSLGMFVLCHIVLHLSFLFG